MKKFLEPEITFLNFQDNVYLVVTNSPENTGDNFNNTDDMQGW